MTLENGIWKFTNITISGNIFSDEYGPDGFHEFTFDLRDRQTHLYYNDELVMTSDDRTESGKIELAGANETWWQTVLLSDDSCLSHCDPKYDCSNRGINQLWNNTGSGCDCLCDCNIFEGCFSGSDCSRVLSHYLAESNCGVPPVGNPPIPLPFHTCVEMCRESEDCMYLGYDDQATQNWNCVFFSECHFDDEASDKYRIYQSENACLTGPVSGSGDRYLKLLSSSSIIEGELHLHFTLPQEYTLSRLEFVRDVTKCASLNPPSGCENHWHITSLGCLNVFTGVFNVTGMFDYGQFSLENIYMFSILSTIHHAESNSNLSYNFDFYIVLNTIIELRASIELVDGCENVDCGTCMICDTGVCVLSNETDGLKCSDLNPLTVRDQCSNGVCIGEEICACGSCEQCIITNEQAECIPDLSLDWTECSDGENLSLDYAFSATCQKGYCVRELLACDCGCDEITHTNCVGRPCCNGGTCTQNGTNSPTCEEGFCFQTASIFPTCDVGNCYQNHSKYPTCKGGGCAQNNAVSPQCDGGRCDQTGACNPSCLGGGCKGNCNFMDCGCLSCFRGECVGPAFLTRGEVCGNVGACDGQGHCVQNCDILPEKDCLTCTDGVYIEDGSLLESQCGDQGVCISNGTCQELICDPECGPCQQCAVVSDGKYCATDDSAGGCPPCQMCRNGRCVADVQTELKECDDQNADTYGGRCNEMGECMTHTCADDLGTLASKCCPDGGCAQEDVEHPSCEGGCCNQIGAIEPSCEGGRCVQTHAIRPSCAGGHCIGNCDFMQCQSCHTCRNGICVVDHALDWTVCGDNASCEAGVCVSHPLFIEGKCGSCQYWVGTQCYARAELEGTDCSTNGVCEGGRCVVPLNEDLIDSLQIQSVMELATLMPEMVSQTRFMFESHSKNSHVALVTPGDFQLSLDCSISETICRQIWYLNINNHEFCATKWKKVVLHVDNSTEEVSSGQVPARDSRMHMVEYNVSLTPITPCGAVFLGSPLDGQVHFNDASGATTPVNNPIYYAGERIYFSLSVTGSSAIIGLDVPHLSLRSSPSGWFSRIAGVPYDTHTSQEVDVQWSTFGAAVKWEFTLALSIFNHLPDNEEIQVTIGVLPLSNDVSDARIPLNFATKFTFMRFRCVPPNYENERVEVKDFWQSPCPPGQKGEIYLYCGPTGWDDSQKKDHCYQADYLPQPQSGTDSKHEEFPWTYHGFIAIFCFLVCSGILSSIFQRFRVTCVNGFIHIERRAQVKTFQKRGSSNSFPFSGANHRYNLSSMFSRHSGTGDKHSQAVQGMFDHKQMAHDCGEDSDSEDCRNKGKVYSPIDPRLNQDQNNQDQENDVKEKARASAHRKQSLRDSTRISRSEKRASRIAPRRTSARLSVRQVNGPRWGDLRRGSKVPSMRISRSTRMMSERLSRSEKRASRSPGRASRKMSYSYSEEFSKPRSKGNRKSFVPITRVKSNETESELSMDFSPRPLRQSSRGSDGGDADGMMLYE